MEVLLVLGLLVKK